MKIRTVKSLALTFFGLLLSLSLLPKLYAQTTEKYRDTGPDSVRLTLAITGDGYTAGQQTQFRNNAISLINNMLTSSPWNTYSGNVNVYFVGAVSNQSGADQPPLNIYRDTTFDASYWASGIERLLTVNVSKVLSHVSARVPTYDFIFVLVNDTKYGGSGGTLAVTSLEASAKEILIHEVGHSYAKLADEYVSYSGSYTGGEPTQPNVTKQTDRNLIKWKAFIAPTTPIPTVPQYSYPTQTGLFEGAYYYPAGVYRPAYNCEMRALGVPFCQVCKEAHARTIHNYAPLVDSVTPPTTSGIRILSPQTFTAYGTGYQYLTYQWSLDGSLIGSESSVTVQPSNVAQPSSRLILTVTDATPLIANYAPSSTTYTWNLSPPPTVLSSISQAKDQVKGAYVTLSGLVSAAFGSYYYVQDEDRTAGIRVSGSSSSLVVGKKLSLTGTLDASGPELILTGIQVTIDPAAPKPPLPILMTGKSLVGKARGLQQGVIDGIGPNNACLLAKLVGKVSPIGATSFYVNDGSGVNVTVLVPSGVSVPAANKYVAVTGISSCGKSGTTTFRQIRVRNQGDIQVLQ